MDGRFKAGCDVLEVGKMGGHEVQGGEMRRPDNKSHPATTALSNQDVRSGTSNYPLLPILGFPVTKYGIDFMEHWDLVIAKTQALKNFLQLHSDTCTPRVELNIFKDYLGLCMEYGFPLFAASVKSGDGKVILKPWSRCELNAWNGLVAVELITYF